MQCQCFCQINSDDHRIGKELFPCNGENVGQYQLWSIIIVWSEINITSLLIIVWSRISIISSLDDDLRSILCHQRGPADHWYHRSLPLLLAQPLDFLVGDIWICLETAFGFVSQNIYISPGFNFPYFRSSPLSISPAAEWHHIFLLNCPEKKEPFLARFAPQTDVWNPI